MITFGFDQPLSSPSITGGRSKPKCLAGPVAHRYSRVGSARDSPGSRPNAGHDCEPRIRASAFSAVNFAQESAGYGNRADQARL